MITISQQVLNQIDRQIDFAYFMAGIVVSIAIFVVGYQVYINNKALDKLKKDNKKEIDKAISSLNTDFLLAQLNNSFNVYTEKQIDSWLKAYSTIKKPDSELIAAIKEVKDQYLFILLDSEGFHNIMSNYPVKEKIKKDGINEDNKLEYIQMYLALFTEAIENGERSKEELTKYYEAKVERALKESAKFKRHGL